jgi:hypothetical protein
MLSFLENQEKLIFGQSAQAPNIRKFGEFFSNSKICNSSDYRDNRIFIIDNSLTKDVENSKPGQKF